MTLADYAQKLMNLTIDDEYFSLLSDLIAAEIITDFQFHGTGVHPLVGEWLREHGIDFQEAFISDRAGNLNSEKVEARISKPLRTAAYPKGKLRCDRIYQNVLLPNGDVALCCMDWSAEYVLGNLKRDRFEDLYRSETFRRVLRGLRKPVDKDLLTYCIAGATSFNQRQRRPDLRGQSKRFPPSDPALCRL